MNGLDYAIMAAVALGAVWGVSRGVVRMVGSIVAVVVGVYLASVYYQRLGALATNELSLSPAAGATLGYCLILVGALVAITVINRMTLRLLHLADLTWVDRLGGSVMGAAVAAALAGLVVVALTALLPADTGVLRGSKLAPRVLAYNERLASYIPREVRDAYESKRAELLRYWALHDSASAGERSGKTD